MVQGQGEHLMSHVSEETLDTILKGSRAAMEASLTTRGLTSSIRQLSNQMVASLDQATRLADNMLTRWIQAIHGFTASIACRK